MDVKSLVEVKTYDLKTGPRGEIRDNINMNKKIEKLFVMNWYTSQGLDKFQPWEWARWEE